MSRKALLLAVVLALTALFTVATYDMHDRPSIGIEDANIFFVYASNIAGGHGFVYNVGGERVEGATSLLWVLLCALCFALFGAPERAVLVLSAMLLAMTHLAIVMHLDRRFRPPGNAWWNIPAAVWAYLVLVFAAPAHVTWMTISLMDTPLWGSLIALTTVFLLTDLERDRRRSAWMFSGLVSLLLLARPEAIALCPILIVVIRWTRDAVVNRDVRTATRSALLPMGTYLGVLLALTVFRYLYFGFPLPNTYYAKVSPSIMYNLANGVSYLGEFVRFGPVVAAAVLLVFLLLAYRAAGLLSPPFKGESILQRTVELFGDTSLLAVLCGGLLLIPVINGGDHFPWFRFYQPVYPILLLFLIYFTRDIFVSAGIRPTTAQRYLPGAVLVVFAFMYAQADTNWRGLRSEPPFGLELAYARGGWTAGERFAEVFSMQGRYPSLGVLSAGGVRRTYPGEVVDLIGLNHVRMGHSPGNRKGIKNHAAFSRVVFYETRPEVIWLRTIPQNPEDVVGTWPYADFMYRALRGLPDDPEFRSLYQYAWVRPKGSDRGWAEAYYHKPVLDELLADERFEIRTWSPPSR